MDPSSIITQVNGPQGESNQKSGMVKDSGEPLNVVIDKPSKGRINIVRSNSKSDAGGHPKHPEQPSVGGSGGSRFLSQLLCCFGLGHTPDYAVSQQQQQQKGEKEAELAEHCSPQQSARDGPAESHYEQLSDYAGDTTACLLAPAESDMAHRICAVIDLDETLVHSSFRCNGSSDFAIQVEVDGIVHQVYVLKRPFADEFLARMGQLFECVLFTASMGKYADPVSDVIDPGGAFKHRLFREACVYHCDSYVKDLATLGRPVDRCVIIDNSPASYMFNVENAIRVQTWMGEPDDTELRDLLPYMEELARAESVSAHLRNNPPPQSPPLSMEQLVAQMQRMEDDC